MGPDGYSSDLYDYVFIMPKCDLHYVKFHNTYMVKKIIEYLISCGLSPLWQHILPDLSNLSNKPSNMVLYFSTSNAALGVTYDGIDELQKENNLIRSNITEFINLVKSSLKNA